MTNYITSTGVQQFSITIASGSLTGTVTINTVGSGAFILWGGLNPSVANNISESVARITLTNANTITATRQLGTTGTVVVTGSIIDGDTTNLIKSVQYGTVTIAVNGLSGTAAINPVTNTNTAVALLGWSSSETTVDAQYDYPVISLSGTTVTATLGATITGTNGAIVGFCVIEFQGSALNSSTQQLQATSSSSVTSYTQAVSSVNVNNTICIYGGFNIDTVSGNYAEAKQYGTLTSSTLFTVHVNTAIADAKAYNFTVVEFVSGVLNSAVQRNTTTLTGVVSNTSTLSSINEAYSAVNWLGNSASTTASDLNRVEGAASLSVNNLVQWASSLGSTVTLPGPSILGDTLIVLITTDVASGPAITVSSITDNKGQTYIQVPSAQGLNQPGAAYLSDIWYVLNSDSGVTSVTATLAGTPAEMHMEVQEANGIPASAAIDVSGNVSNQSATNHPVTAPLSTTQPYDLIFTIVNHFGGTPSAVTAPYTQLNGSSSLAAYYNPITAVSSSTATFTVSGSDTYCASSVAFFTTPTNLVTVTKNNATGNITGSWEVFEFPAYVAPPSGSSYIFIGGFL